MCRKRKTRRGSLLADDSTKEGTLSFQQKFEGGKAVAVDWQFDHRNERPKKERRMRETHQHKRGKQRIKLCERMDFSISARCAFSSVRRTSYRIKLS